MTLRYSAQERAKYRPGGECVYRLELELSQNRLIAYPSAISFTSFYMCGFSYTPFLSPTFQAAGLPGRKLGEDIVGVLFRFGLTQDCRKLVALGNELNKSLSSKQQTDFFWTPGG